MNNIDLILLSIISIATGFIVGADVPWYVYVLFAVCLLFVISFRVFWKQLEVCNDCSDDDFDTNELIANLLISCDNPDLKIEYNGKRWWVKLSSRSKNGTLLISNGVGDNLNKAIYNCKQEIK